LHSFEDEPDLVATWKVSRLHTTDSLRMMKVYQDIERKMENGLPIDLSKYIR
jgi:hypothetical protein